MDRAVAACALFLSFVAMDPARAQAPVPPPCVKPQSSGIPLEEVATLSKTIVPQEWSFDIAEAGTYEVQLVDLGQSLPAPLGPAPLGSLKLALTRGATVVGQAVGSAGQTMRFEATPGTYAVHVVGSVGTQAASGPFGVRIFSLATSPAAMVFECSSSITTVQTIPQNQRVHQATFRIATSGDYEITLADLKFPQALRTAGVFVFRRGASQLAAFIPQPTDPPTPQTFNLPAADYEMIAAGALTDGTDGGLFSVHIKSVASSDVVLSRSIEVGRVQSLGDVMLTGGAHVLEHKDLQFPAALQSRAVIIAHAAQSVASATAADPGELAFNVATDGLHQVFAYAAADGTAGAGGYYTEVRPSGGAPKLASAQMVATSTGGPFVYTFLPKSALAAGAYRVRLADFEFPAFANARLALVQDGTVLGSTAANAAGPVWTLDVPSVAAGKPTLIAVVRPGPATPVRGLFGIDVAAAGGGSAVFEVTQGVGALFSSRRLPIVEPGRHDARIVDLEFPAQFADLAAVLTRGTQKLSTFVVSGGQAEFAFNATPGDYFINFIAEPNQNQTEQAGTYAIAVMQSPPLPAITLSANPTRVRSGSTTSLTWSTQNATSCTAEGAWIGTRNLSGTETSTTLTASSTFTLRCRGAGADSDQTQSVTVEIETAAAEDGGGGGALGVPLLFVLSLYALARSRRERLRY